MSYVEMCLCRSQTLADLQEWRSLRQLSEHGVDAAKVELYLNPSGFIAAFNLCRDDFILLPKWKRDMLKKQVGLF